MNEIYRSITFTLILIGFLAITAIKSDDPTSTRSTQSTTRTTRSTTVSPDIFVIQSPYDCSFDVDFCSWTNDTGEINWVRRSGASWSTSTGPQNDHTYGNKTGYYLYFDTYTTTPYRKARIQSALITDLQDRCLEFYYHMYGSSMGELNVYLKKNGQYGSTEWSRIRNQGNRWIRGELRIKNMKEPYQILFEGVFMGTYSTIGLDDIRLLGSCPLKNERFCDFEAENSCNYTNLETNNYDWVRSSRSILNYGPPTDHSTGSSDGYFMHVTGLSTNKVQKSALVSNAIFANAEQCVEFYYYQEASIIGRLNIYAKFVNQSVSEIGFPLWTETPVYNSWQVAQVSLGNAITNSEFQVLFEEYVEGTAPGNKFNIYIDDVFIRDSSCLPPGDCDFENGFCSWSSVFSISDFDWILDIAPIDHDDPRPPNDHSTGGEHGHFIYALTSYPGTSAYLSSEVFEATSPKGRCMTFWFYISGPAAILSFYVNEINTQNPILTWNLDGSGVERKWNYGSFGFYYDKHYTILVKGSSSDANQSAISLDDIVFKESQYCAVTPSTAHVGSTLPLPVVTKAPTTTRNPSSTPAPSAIDCNFETDFCNWINDANSPLKWKRNQGYTSNSDFAPTIDNTIGNELGWYIFMEGVTTAKVNDTARLESVSTISSQTNCLSFFYHMKGIYVDALNVYVKYINQNTEAKIWSKRGNQGNVWINAQVNIVSDEAYRLIFEAVRGTLYLGEISLDDVTLKSGYCETNEFFYCDFDSGICGFTNETVSKHYWLRATGKYASTYTNTGPNVDQTTNSPSGYYLIAPGNSSASAGDKARINSPRFNFDGLEEFCLTWYYHMLGTDMGWLNVYLNMDDRSGLLWRFSRNIGNVWNFAQATITRRFDANNFSITFEGTKGTGTLSSIALDTIKIEYGRCTEFGACTFENNNYCAWSNVIDSRDQYDWEFGSFQSKFSSTGPQFDHTYGDTSGSYLIAESNTFILKGNKAILESTVLLPTPTYGICMNFWYHMYGFGMGALNIYLNVSNTATLLWTQNGDKGSEWFNGQFGIKSASDYRISIEAVRGLTIESSIAIDDIDFVEKECDIHPENAGPENFVTIPYQPSTRSARPLSLIDCSFENNFCIWTHIKESTFNWTRVQGTTGGLIGGPISEDHTFGTPDGWYISVDTANRQSTDFARIQSNSLTGTRCMEFYYYFFAPGTKYEFHIYSKVSEQYGQSIWSRHDSNADLWRQARVTVGSASNYQVVLEMTGIQFGSVNDKFGLDDIYFTDGACEDSIEINGICTFTNGDTCGFFINSTISSFEWTVYNPQSGAQQAPIPIFDHTSEGVGSGYLYAKSTGSNRLNDSTSLFSKMYMPFDSLTPNASARCLEFYFYIENTDAVTLNVITFTSPTAKNFVWSRNYAHKGYWWKAEASFKLLLNYTYQIQAVVGTKPENGLIAIDDIGLRNGDCSSLSGVCDFDYKDLCNWVNVKDTDDFDWTLEYSSTATYGTGPSYDHTLNTYRGYYIYIETSNPTLPGWKAQLASEPQLDSNEGCIYFWYHMYGTGLGTLNVYLSTIFGMQKLWTLTGEKGSSWLPGAAPFKSDVTHQIVFEGIKGDTQTGDIALDDLIIKREKCEVQPSDAVPQVQSEELVSCGFNNNSFCFWKKDLNISKFDWALQNPTDVVPSQGASLGALSSTGYIFVRRAFSATGDRTRLISPVVSKPADDGYCFTFYYYMFGSDIGNLEVYVINYNNLLATSTSIFTLNGTQVQKWIPKHIFLSKEDINYDFIIGVDAVLGTSFQGIIGVDEFSLTIGKCPPNPTCDFEEGFCGWTFDLTADFNWTRQRGPTEPGLTGPSYDHTTHSENGHYIFIETSAPQKPGQKARLISPTYSPTQHDGNCFMFYYHLFGSSIGSLNVWTRVANTLDRNIWSRQGNFGNYWRYGHVTVKSESDFQMVLEGVVGSSNTGDAAVDDILFENGPCPTEGSCDFENDYCGYLNTREGDDFDWERGKGRVYYYTGPGVDHTTNTVEGYYIFINPSSSMGHKAWLISELMTTPNPACFSWYMHMWGTSIGKLSVYQRIGDQNPVSIWTKSGEMGDFWIKGEVTLATETRYFDLILEATRGDGIFGNIALDDIEMAPGGTCEFFNSTTTTIQPTTLQPEAKFYCNFENDMCEWSPDESSDVFWTRQNGLNAKYGTAPLSDVSYQNSFGYYAYINAYYEGSLKTAILKSPNFDNSHVTCLEFWYQLGGAASSGLAVALRNRDNKVVLWRRSGNAADVWSHAYVTVSNATLTNKWVEFEGDMSNLLSGYVAIDEVKLLISECPTLQYCDFETDDICNFEHDITGDFKWERNKATTSTIATGPQYDHTYQTSAGHYMYIEGSTPQKPGQKARLISQTIKRKPDGICLNFWYHAYGNNIDTLNVYTRKGGQLSEEPIWSVSKDQSDQWRTTAITVDENVDYQIVFEGIIGNSFDCDIAIDDIFIDTKGPCKPTASCNFEDSICLWSQLSTNGFNMLRITSQQMRSILGSSINGLINADTTLNDRNGHFLWINAAYSSIGSKRTSDLMSETIFHKNYKNDLCLTFNFIINGGGDPGKINIYRKFYGNISRTLESSVNSSKGNDWKRQFVPLTYLPVNYEIYLEFALGTTNGSIAIDDVVLHEQNCTYVESIIDKEEFQQFRCGDGNIITMKEVCNFIQDCSDNSDETSCGDCDFENSTCNYRESSTTSLKWVRKTGQSAENGPFVDATQNSKGYFMIVDVDDWVTGSVFGSALLKLDRLLKPCSSSCQLELYYHMYGVGDDLVISILEENSKSLLESFSGDFGDKWNFARVPIGKISTPFQLEFRGARYFSDSDFDLAIDEVKLINCEYPITRPSCPSDYFTCHRKACVPSSQVCDLIDDCGDGSDELDCSAYTQCDFENGFCDWSHDLLSGAFKWQLNKGETGLFSTGPTRDHTTGTSQGQYAFIKASDQINGDKARLLSPVLKLRSQSVSCEMRLYYHMYGKNIGSLNVYLRSGVGGNEQVLIQKQGEVGNFWERIDLLIDYTNPFQIIIEGVVGNGMFGNMAIDDISFTPNCIIDDTATLATGVTYPTTTETSVCAAQRTLFSKKHWRVTIEALSGTTSFSDIAIDDLSSTPGKCPPTKTCDFEAGDFCDFNNVNDNTANLKWLVGSPFPTSIDHTTSTSTGKFAYLNAKDATLDSKARLESATYSQTGAECVQFWYMFQSNAQTTAKLNVYEKVNGNYGQPKWSKVAESRDYRWTYGQVEIGESTQSNYTVVFEAVKLTAPMESDLIIGLDDVNIRIGECKPAINCDFEEENICSWYQYESDELDWLLNKGQTDTSDTGPHVDVTLGTAEGTYLYIEASSPSKAGDRAMLVSEYLSSTTPNNHASCFGLWYFMYGLSVGDLIVSINDTQNGMSMLKNISGEQGFNWQPLLINVTNPNDFTIVVQAVVGKSFDADIAIDELTYSTSPCEAYTTAIPSTRTTTTKFLNNIDCTFDNNSTCSWYHDTTSQFAWKVWSGPTPNVLTGPSADHTTESTLGYYIYAQASSQQNGDIARITSNNLDVSFSSGGCFKFFYHMFGVDVSRLNVYQQFSNTTGFVNNSKPVWHKQGNQGDQWHYGQVFVGGSSIYRVRFILEAIVGKGPYGDIAVDDISLNSGACPVLNSCDFESVDICGYKNDASNGGFSWTREEGTDQRPDQTYGASLGHYMLAQSINPHTKDRKARLLTPTYSASTTCVKFWYKTNGDVEFNLRLFTLGSYTSKAYFNVIGERGNEWSLGQATVSYTVPYQVVFETVDQGPTMNNGSVFLDDISIDFKSCPQLGSCDFEDGLCGYKLLSSSDFDWIILNGEFGSTQNTWDVPTTDHTTGSSAGSFIYLDTNEKQEGEMAQMESEVLTENLEAHCLQLYLNLNMYNLATLKISRKNKVTSEMSEIYTMSKYEGDGWRLKQVDIPSLSYPSSFVIAGVVGNNLLNAGKKGRFAIDDLILKKGKCEITTPTTIFNCSNGQTIDISLVCDFHEDCSNGNDERNCGACNFEEDLCGWQDISSGSYKWIKTRNASVSDNIGPNVDHTLNTEYGSYLGVTVNSGNTFMPATLYSATYAQAHATCWLKFWHTLYGSGSSLNVSININNERMVPVFRRDSNSQATSWTLASVKLGTLFTKFDIVFEATRTFSSFGYVTIDDVSLENCEKPPVTSTSCPSGEFKCNRGNCVSMESICDSVDDCGDFSDEVLPICSSYQKCTFEHSMCDWTNDESQELKWTRASGLSPSPYTGPDRDHTIGTDTGYYLRLNADGNSLKSSFLYSRWYNKDSSSECRFSFYYFMLGSNMGSLNLYVRLANSPSTFVKIWSTSGNQGIEWKRLSYVYNQTTQQSFQIILEGIIGSGRESDFALDDTIFSPGCVSSDVQVSTVHPSTTTASTAKTTNPTTTAQTSTNRVGTTTFQTVLTTTRSTQTQPRTTISEFATKPTITAQKSSSDVDLILGILIPAIIIIPIIAYVIYKYNKTKSFSNIFGFKSFSSYTSFGNHNANVESTDMGVFNPVFNNDDVGEAKKSINNNEYE